MKKIRLIELFGGYGSQHLALKYIGADFEQWKLCEWAVKSIQAYKDLHFGNDNFDYSNGLTQKDIVDYLYSKHISMDYNTPMSYDQIKRMREVRCRQIYNNIKATHDLVDIKQVKGKDLEIVDTDQYMYICTYSFPCQDLSLAGKRAGMQRDSGTRSGMLWEVERILKECEILPQVLLMENVPQVHGKKNKEDFDSWCEFLVSLGYKNYWQDLNAKDYGVPQSRKRTFMISILNGADYKFPTPIPLEIKLQDLLEDEVDEKYFLTDRMVNYICSNNDKWTGNNGKSVINREIGCTINTRVGNTRADSSDYICDDLPKNTNLKNVLCNKLIQDGLVSEGDIVRHSYTNNRLNNGKKNMARTESKDKISPTLDTRCDCLGIVVKTDLSGNVFKTKGIKQLDETIEQNNLSHGTILDLYNRTCHNNIAQTIDTGYHNSQRVCVKEPCVVGGIGEKKSNGGSQWYQQDRVYDNNMAISVTTAFNPYYKTDLRIRKLTPKECFRLMGVKDEDFEKIAQNQSNASLYHLAGDSIVVDVLMAIFRELLKE